MVRIFEFVAALKLPWDKERLVKFWGWRIQAFPHGHLQYYLTKVILVGITSPSWLHGSIYSLSAAFSVHLLKCVLFLAATFVSWRTQRVSTASAWISLYDWQTTDSSTATSMSLTWWLMTTAQSQCSTSLRWCQPHIKMHSGELFITDLGSIVPTILNFE